MKNRRLSGFTLIELMIVVVIIGILASIAYPSYTKWMYQTRRAEAQIALTKLANEQEKFYSECSAYSNSITAARTCAAGGLGQLATSTDGNYALTVVAAATTYTLTATAQGYQANDSECTTLTLNYQGVKGATGSNATSCWKR